MECVTVIEDVLGRIGISTNLDCAIVSKDTIATPTEIRIQVAECPFYILNSRSLQRLSALKFGIAFM